jgi:hypothetical protein
VVRYLKKHNIDFKGFKKIKYQNPPKNSKQRKQESIIQWRNNPYKPPFSNKCRKKAEKKRTKQA